MVDTNVGKYEVLSLPCEDLKEDDTRIVYHAYNISNVAEVVIRYADTVILVILLGNTSTLFRSSLNTRINICYRKQSGAYWRNITISQNIGIIIEGNINNSICI